MGDHVESAERMDGGRNSQVYRITGRGGSQYVAKLYFKAGIGDRDRLEAEYSGLSFLWENGERAIPQPIAVDRDSRCALYEYIEGTRMPSSRVNESSIDQIVAFATRLNGMADCAGSAALPPASEACFSVAAIVSNINARLVRLQEAEGGHPGLKVFLNEEFGPTLDSVVQWCHTYADSNGIGFDTELPADQRTLSPSDLGFHNSIKRPGGAIVFLDFEHFGWDDPAKLASDFLLHPAMDLTVELKHRFFRGILDGFQTVPLLASRIQMVYPLFGLKWCMILLNEFLSCQMARRGFASPQSMDKIGLQAGQLKKSQRMLQKVTEEYDHFPYRN